MTGGGAAEPGQAGYCGRTSDLLHLSHLLCHLRKQGARETQSCPLSYNNYSLLARLASSGVEMQALYVMSPTQSFAGGWGLRCIIAGEILTLLFSFFFIISFFLLFLFFSFHFDFTVFYLIHPWWGKDMKLSQFEKLFYFNWQTHGVHYFLLSSFFSFSEQIIP